MQTAQMKVREIHTAVNEASDLLLMDAPYDNEAVASLMELGFTSAGNVADHDDHALNSKYARMYQQKYPMYKFITKHQMDRIREKYQLEEGSLTRFKGDIPKKNIQEMVGFSIERSDIRVETASWTGNFPDDWSKFLMGTFEVSPLRMRTHTPLFMDDIDIDVKRHGDTVKVSRSRYGALTPFEAFGMDASRRDKKRDEFLQKQAEEERVRGTRRMTFSEINKEFQRAITITADKALFKAPDPVLDPIVTVAVAGGYLIVTAWGAEASDPDVVNHLNN